MSRPEQVLPTLCTRFACIATAVLFSGLCAAGEFKIAGETMGTNYHVKWTAEHDNSEDLQNQIDDRLAAINALMSTYDPQSEISRFNDAKTTDPIQVAPETMTVVAAALKMAETSGGAFDPTVGRLVRLWGFGAGSRTNTPPADADIQEALNHIGYTKIVLHEQSNEISKTDPEVEIDLSAIAKGFGVDQVFELLAQNGINNCMVEIGGEVRVGGSKNGEKWTLGIERPEVLQRSLFAKVELQDQALATSGDYRNNFEFEGVRYSHTIDPRTGKPVTHNLASASIIAEDCMTADAWATTMLVLGPQAGLTLANQENVKAYLLNRDENDFQVLASGPVSTDQFEEVAAHPAAAAAETPLWKTFLLTLAVFGIAITLLAVGAIFANKPLKGSCGGVAGTKDEQGRSVCDLCTTPPEECDQLKEKLRQELMASQQSDDA